MKILLDENITSNAKCILQRYGHDVIEVLDKLPAGTNDESVFKLAQKEDRAIITQNGKDFVILIPPYKKDVNFSGLIWLKTQVTRKTCNSIMSTIGDYFKNNTYIKNTYYRVKEQNGKVIIEQRYPNSK